MEVRPGRPFLPSFRALLFPVLLSPARGPLPSEPHRGASSGCDLQGWEGEAQGGRGWGLGPMGKPGGAPLPSPGLTFLLGKVECAQRISGCKLLTSKGHSARFPALPSLRSYHFGGVCLSSPPHLFSNDGCVFPAFVRQGALGGMESPAAASRHEIQAQQAEA